PKRIPHQQERPPRLPALTNIILHQPRQRLNAIPPALLPADIHRAVPVDVALRAPQLDGDDDEEQGAHGDEVEEEDEECYAQGADGDVIREVPVHSFISTGHWSSLLTFQKRAQAHEGGFKGKMQNVPGSPDSKLRLHRAETGKDPEHGARGDEDDEEPEVELRGGPAVFAAHEAHGARTDCTLRTFNRGATPTATRPLPSPLRDASPSQARTNVPRRLGRAWGTGTPRDAPGRVRRASGQVRGVLIRDVV
ncbi:hypothetical protein V494_08320, partial [Pseudogymnoascus sp. VKM F-4513 (FW-928)]